MRQSPRRVEKGTVVTVGDVLRRGLTVFAVVGMMSCLPAASGWADPEVEPVADAPAPEAAPAPAPPEVAPPPPPPVDDGRIESTPPATTGTPDGWTLTLSAKDETQAPIPPLTTALSSREYVVGGTYMGDLAPPEDEDADLPGARSKSGTRSAAAST